MPDDPATSPGGAAAGAPGAGGPPPPDPAPGPPAPVDPPGDAGARRLAAVLAGHRGDAAAARRALGDPDPAVRGAAIGAVARTGTLAVADVLAGLSDPHPSVRRRACSAAPGVAGRGARSSLPDALRRVLGDPDPLVAESACWALGERRVRGAVPDLAAVAGDHPDARCRESAVAALGAVGDPAGLPAVLGALGDRPAVRRRAAVALAAFDGPEVAAALHRCLEDRDWQVRQVAEILLGT